ncbi:WhiB family transcriptional regulator [Streptomyces sp. NPDC051642]|uniref:WhiB family transcriptional regulator n=1 Tax=Streptomyces sp. NPDC051642 TaxID=3154646 RepID=UPI003435FE6E
MRDLDWMGDARCAQVDPDLWHPDESGATHTYSDARCICRRCPVRQQCTDYATAIESDGDKKDRHGVWAGETKDERGARSTRQARANRHEVIVRLVERGGMNPQEIADHVGVTVRTVARITKAHREQMAVTA